MRATVTAVSIAVLLLAGCDSDSSTITDTPVASDLAPSQTLASTVAPPTVPSPCAASTIETWTASVQQDSESAYPVIRVRNTSDVECEIDITGTEIFDHDVAEPDVWLEPHGWADLHVGPRTDVECSEPTASATLALVVNRDVMEVPTIVVSGCALEVAAFFPIDAAEEPCPADAISVASFGTGAWIVARNDGETVCHLGALTGAGQPPLEPSLPIVDLAPGDVVGWNASAWNDMCGRGPRTYEFESVTIAVDDDWLCEQPSGAGRPFHGDPGSPAAVATTANYPIEEVLQLVDPFELGRQEGT